MGIYPNYIVSFFCKAWNLYSWKPIFSALFPGAECSLSIDQAWLLFWTGLRKLNFGLRGKFQKLLFWIYSAQFTYTNMFTCPLQFS